MEEYENSYNGPGVVRYFTMMREELGLQPDVITFAVVLKAKVSSRRHCNMVEINSILSDMTSLHIQRNKYTYGQLLLAYKRNRWVDQALKWFDELLNADIAPTKNAVWRSARYDWSICI